MDGGANSRGCDGEASKWPLTQPSDASTLPPKLPATIGFEQHAARAPQGQ